MTEYAENREQRIRFFQAILGISRQFSTTENDGDNDE